MAESSLRTRKTLWLTAALAISASIAFTIPSAELDAQPQGAEPIAYVGHGAFFDSRGAQILPTAAFIDRAQSWYIASMTRNLSDAQKREYASFERRLVAGLDLRGQTRLVLRQRLLDWLFAQSTKPGTNERLGSKLSALRYQLTFNLPSENQKGNQIWDLGSFVLDPVVARRLASPDFRPSGGRSLFKSTTNAGQAYIDECVANQVPIPPTINQMDPNGTAGWKIEGEIPPAKQFIVQSPAEVRTFSSPQGMCIALPRYNSNKTTVALDGVICLSKITSKVCIWDNQSGGGTFSFPANTRIPIGVPNTAIDPAGRYQGGGAELTSPTGGICTDCHAGENPYIVHPDAELRTGFTMGDLGAALPMYAPQRYEPIVLASWAQNDLSHAGPLVPGECSGCHEQGGSGGRFPHLSDVLEGYCGTIMRGAVAGLPVSNGLPLGAAATMPQGNAGAHANNNVVNAFRAMCNTSPTSGPAGRGDPHLTTTNGINYDFQAAGEFTALRNSSNGFELQVRQTPVSTSFTPGPNPYTGLASCVSVNSAAALRLGQRRVTYQQDRERMTLRVDGRPVRLAGRGIDLGDGHRIAPTVDGEGIDVAAADGTRVLITPNFWASQGHWYLNVDVVNTPAREGTMGHIPGANWLPLGPTGQSFGALPAALATRDLTLNRLFASAWRVTPANSLFDYAPGTSTATFTDRNWPPRLGRACVVQSGVPSLPAAGRPRLTMMPRERAERLCRPLREDKAAFNECLFDVVTTGEPGFARAYARSLAARAAVQP